MDHQKMISYSDLDLMGYEEEFLMAANQNFFSTWMYNRRRKGKEVLKVSVPVRAYIRLESLLEYIPSNYALEISDIFEMLVDNTLKQYGKEIAPRNVFATIRNMEKKAKLTDNGETKILTYRDKKQKKIKVKLDYKRLLFLEGVMEDMDTAVEECEYTVEDFLSILFTDFMKRLQAGQVPALAREIGKHIEGGETA